MTVVHRSVYASFDPLPSMEFPYASGDPRGCVLDRIPSKVSIACGCLHLGMTEQFADYGEVLAELSHGYPVD